MSDNVLHILRKSSQLRATFIKNQISNHIRYKPFIVYKEKSEKLFDGGYDDFESEKYEILNLAEGNKRKTFKYLKRISDSDKRKIKKFIELHSIDFLHLHYGTDAGLYKKIIEECGIPSVVSFYGYEVSSFPNILLGLGKLYLKKRVFNLPSKFLAMTPEMKKDLLELGCDEKKIIVHYHGILGSIYYYPSREYVNRDRIIILMVGSLVLVKGHKFLLDGIIELVKRGYRNFELRLIGDGELEFELKDYIKKNELTDYVKFLGSLKAHSPDILNEYKNADIFILPSIIPGNGDKEGLPGTIVEAMFSGLPVISTFHGGIPYVIEDGKTGLLVKEWDVDKLAHYIQDLMENVEMRKMLGNNAQKFAVENLNLSIKEKELERIYDDVRASY